MNIDTLYKEANTSFYGAQNHFLEANHDVLSRNKNYLDTSLKYHASYNAQMKNNRFLLHIPDIPYTAKYYIKNIQIKNIKPNYKIQLIIGSNYIFSFTHETYQIMVKRYNLPNTTDGTIYLPFVLPFLNHHKVELHITYVQDENPISVLFDVYVPLSDELESPLVKEGQFLYVSWWEDISQSCSNDSVMFSHLTLSLAIKTSTQDQLYMTLITGNNEIILPLQFSYKAGDFHVYDFPHMINMSRVDHISISQVKAEDVYAIHGNFLTFVNGMAGIHFSK